MNTYLQLGSTIVVLALVSYSIAILTEQRKRKISKLVLTFLSLGVCLDIIATAFMVYGSSKSGLSLHGVIGYSSLAAMFIDAILMWRQKSKTGINSEVPKFLHLYSRYAYIYWVIAFITGVSLVMMN